MDTPLLSTKLYLPPPRPGVVRRARLFALLDEGLRCELTLVSAPAGFGKTTLLSDWLAHVERPGAWLWLDAGERSPPRLLAYLIAALQSRAPGVGAAALAALRSAQPPPDEALLAEISDVRFGKPSSPEANKKLVLQRRVYDRQA